MMWERRREEGAGGARVFRKLTISLYFLKMFDDDIIPSVESMK